MKGIWTKVAALTQSDEAQNARIQQLEEEVAALKFTISSRRRSGIGRRNTSGRVRIRGSGWRERHQHPGKQ